MEEDGEDMEDEDMEDEDDEDMEGEDDENMDDESEIEDDLEEEKPNKVGTKRHKSNLDDDEDGGEELDIALKQLK